MSKFSLSEETSMVETAQALSQTPSDKQHFGMRSKRKQPYHKPSGKQNKAIAQLPQRYQCPEGHAHIYVLGNRYRIAVLLDSGSNIFLINETLVHDLNIPYESRTDTIPIQGFTGETLAAGGSQYTHPLYLEIGQNHHLSLVSCEIPPAGKYGMIIPFGWWHQEHPISNITDSKSWNFTDDKCRAHLLPEDEGISIEWDEDVLNDPNAVTIGRIEQVDDEKITILDRLPEVYHDYLDLFDPQPQEN